MSVSLSDAAYTVIQPGQTITAVHNGKTASILWRKLIDVYNYQLLNSLILRLQVPENSLLKLSPLSQRKLTPLLAMSKLQLRLLKSKSLVTLPSARTTNGQPTHALHPRWSLLLILLTLKGDNWLQSLRVILTALELVTLCSGVIMVLTRLRVWARFSVELPAEVLPHKWCLSDFGSLGKHI
jgi:hypothetical protein